MNSREKILQAIKENKPDFISLPCVDDFSTQSENLLDTFIENLQTAGGYCVSITNLDAVNEFVAQQKQKGADVIVGVDGIDGFNLDEVKSYTGLQLQEVDTAVVKGVLAVAENGAIWLTDTNIGNRILPFICQHLIIIIKKESICANMHEAYKQVKIDQEGYGVFIAGPSKTADIEQSLVVGAHGPLSLQVYII